MVAPLVVRASSLESSKKCTGYAGLAANKQSEDTVYTLTGTLVHLYLEKCIRAGSVLTAEKSDWQKMSDDTFGNKFKEPEDTFVEVVSFANWFFREYPEIAQAYNGEKGEVELSLQLAYPGLNAKLCGTVDYVVYDNDTIVVVDWKNYTNLDWLPDPSVNPQLFAYAVLASEKYNCQRVKVGLGLVKYNEMQWREFSPQELLVVRAKVDKLVEQAVEGYNKFNIGPHCDKCMVRSKCPSFLENSYYLSRGLQCWDGSIPKTNEEALYLHRSIGSAEERVNMAKNAVKDFIKKEGLILDYSAGKKYCRRSWVKKDIDRDKKGRTFNILKKHMGDDAKKAINVSLSSIKRALKDSSVGVEAYQDIIDDLHREGVVVEKNIKSMKWVKV